MKQGFLRGSASLALLFAVVSCSDLPTVPSRDSSGEPVVGASAAPNPAAPIVKVASIVVSPSTLEINAPHFTSENEKPDLQAPDSDASNLEHESAGFPSAALLTVAFLSESGEPLAPGVLHWSSSNPQLLSVDEDGWVQAIDTEVGGVVTVTARLKGNPGVSASSTVTVRNDGMLAIDLK